MSVAATHFATRCTLRKWHICSRGKLQSRLAMQVLNLLLYKLRGEEPDPGLLDLLRADEHLVDIGDDLVDYEVTVLHQSSL